MPIENAGPGTKMTDVEAIALMLGASFVLGVLISVFYRISRRPTEIEPRLPATLVLLSMLITMVTVAVGENVAVAFTLVGTLAIVRFRTAVSDIRDTVFVIFAVAAGISVGNDNMLVGFVGVTIVGLAVCVLRSLSSSQNQAPRETATLQLDVSPPNHDTSVFADALQSKRIRFRVENSRVDRERLRLSISCSNVPREEQTEILMALLEKPEIVNASLEFK